MLLFLFLCSSLPLIFCHTSNFACSGIRNDFIITDKSNVTLFKGTFDFFTTPINDGKTMLIIKPMEISYNIDDTVYTNFGVDASIYSNQNVECNYHGINNSKCYISDIRRVSINGYVWNTKSGRTTGILHIYFFIDQGIISANNGSYIGITTGNISFKSNGINYLSVSNSKCINYSRLPSVDLSLPKCAEMISDVKVYNISDNYNSIASVNVIFTLGSMMNITGMFKPLTERFSIWVNY